MKWITSTDIKQWADTRESQGLLPELIIRLIRATSKDVNSPIWMGWSVRF